MEEQIPRAVHEGGLKIGTVALRLAVLDNGQGVIEHESFMEFFRALEDGTLLMTPEISVEIAKFIRGLK